MRCDFIFELPEEQKRPYHVVMGDAQNEMLDLKLERMELEDESKDLFGNTPFNIQTFYEDLKVFVDKFPSRLLTHMFWLCWFILIFKMNLLDSNLVFFIRGRFLDLAFPLHWCL